MPAKRRRTSYRGSRDGFGGIRQPVSSAENTREESTQYGVSKNIRLPKRPYALVFGYLGGGYHGMQKQTNSEGTEIVRTIEGELEKGLFRAGGISTDNFGKLQKVVGLRLTLPPESSGYQSETSFTLSKSISGDTIGDGTSVNVDEDGEAVEDTSISVTNGNDGTNSNTASQCLELAQRQKSERDFISRLQKELDLLDANIRMFGMYRTTKRFDARALCSKRQYQYLIPLEYLTKARLTETAKQSIGFRFYFKMSSEERKAWLEANSTDDARCGPRGSSHVDGLECAAEPYSCSTQPEARTETNDCVKEADRIIEELSRLCQRYEGRHKFHNFTSRSGPSDASLWRFMEQLRAEKRTLRNFQGKSWTVAVVTIKGQSFLLGQIRKMMALLVEIMRGTAPSWSIEDCLGTFNQRSVHMAPGEGLLLDKVFYDSYNQKRVDPQHTPHLLFDDIECRIRQFKEEVLLPRTVEHLLSDEGKMYAEIYLGHVSQWSTWIESVNRHPFFAENFPPRMLFRRKGQNKVTQEDQKKNEEQVLQQNNMTQDHKVEGQLLNDTLPEY